MIEWIRNTIKAKTLEARNKANEQIILGEAMTRIAKESGIVNERPDSDGFQRIVKPQDREKGHVSGDQREMIRQARKMYRFDPHARGILQTMVNYIVGKGFDIKPKSQDPKINYIWWEFWNNPRSNMQLKRFEMILRFFRDGDCFLEFFSKGDKGIETGNTTVRFVDPLLVKNPADGKNGSVKGSVEIIRNGIEINPNDIEEVVAYHAENREFPGQFRRILAENMVHMKALADSDQRRGETFLQTIMPLIAHYNNWLENRIILNRMRTAIVMIKKVSGTSTELNQLKGNMGPMNSSGQTVVKAGKMLIANDGVDYKMESPNINAQDVAEDGRNIKLAMSAGTNLPEYIFGDASNANFSSSLIAESPFVKAIEYWQIIVELYLKQVYRKVIENAVKAGKLTPPDDAEYFRKLFKGGDLEEAEIVAPTDDEKEDDEADADAEPKLDADDNPIANPNGDPKAKGKQDDMGGDEEDEDSELTGKAEPPSEIFYGCDIQWPEIVHREMKAQTDALMVARTNGWIADSTAAAALGYDYAEEVRKQAKIEEDAEEKPNPLLKGSGMPDPLAGDEGEMDAEMGDIKLDKDGKPIDDNADAPPPNKNGKPKQFAGKGGFPYGN